MTPAAMLIQALAFSKYTMATLAGCANALAAIAISFWASEKRIVLVTPMYSLFNCNIAMNVLIIKVFIIIIHTFAITLIISSMFQVKYYSAETRKKTSGLPGYKN